VHNSYPKVGTRVEHNSHPKVNMRVEYGKEASRASSQKMRMTKVWVPMKNANDH